MLAVILVPYFLSRRYTLNDIEGLVHLRVMANAGVRVRMFPMVSLKLKPLVRAAYMTASASSQARCRVAGLLQVLFP